MNPAPICHKEKLYKIIFWGNLELLFKIVFDFFVRHRIFRDNGDSSPDFAEDNWPVSQKLKDGLKLASFLFDCGDFLGYLGDVCVG